MRERETFNSSRTPKPGEKVREPRVLAKPDIEKLGERIKQVAAQVKANDPKTLKAENAKLRAELKAQTHAPKTAAATKTETKRVEVPILKDAQLQRLERLAKKFDEMLPKIHDERAAAAKRLEDLTNLGTLIADQSTELSGMINRAKAPAAAPRSTTPIPARAFLRPRPFARREPKVATESNGDGGGEHELDGPQRKILAALAWWRALDVHEPTVAQVAAVAGYAMGGTLSTYLGRLSTAGLIVRDRGIIRLSDAGSEVTDPVDAPTTIDELHDRIRATLDGPQTAIINALISHGGEEITTEQLGEESGYAVGGTFNTYLGRLSSRGLIERSRGMVRPTEVLYPPALSSI